MNQPKIAACGTYVQMPKVTGLLCDLLGQYVSVLSFMDWPLEMRETFGNLEANSQHACGLYRESIGQSYSEPLID